LGKLSFSCERLTTSLVGRIHAAAPPLTLIDPVEFLGDECVGYDADPDGEPDTQQEHATNGRNKRQWANERIAPK
jgi:hypothetical protein